MNVPNGGNKITRCLRCGRKLKIEKTIERGMGETCFRKYINENKHKKLFNVLGERYE